ncbi:MAG TPA: TolC family protein [Gemmatimonadales bacterium]|nr:TolC family protein [Gemmatimonadales bacterium]
MTRVSLPALWLATSVCLAPTFLAAQTARPVTLEEAITAGRRMATAAVVARLDVRLANARHAADRAVLLPQIGGSLSADRQTMNLDEFGFPGVSGVTDPFTLLRARVSLRQVLFDRSAWEAIGALRDSLVAADADADRVGAISAIAAGTAWLRLAGAEEEVAARLADSTTAAALLEVAASQVDAGTAARIERTRSETRVAITRGELREARHQVERAAIDLARTMHLPSGTRLDAIGDPTIPFGLPSTPAAAIAQATASRADLHAADTRVDVATRRAAATSLAWWPTIGLTGLVQESGQHADRLGGTWALGLGVQWTPFDGFRRRHELEQANLRIEIARTRRDELRDAIAAEAERAAIDVASAEELITIASDRLALATEELQEAQERFTAGVAGSVETTTAQASVADARDALIQARMALGAAHLSAAGALGLLDATHGPAPAGETTR